MSTSLEDRWGWRRVLALLLVVIAWVPASVAQLDGGFEGRQFRVVVSQVTGEKLVAWRWFSPRAAMGSLPDEWPNDPIGPIDLHEPRACVLNHMDLLVIRCLPAWLTARRGVSHQPSGPLVALAGHSEHIVALPSRRRWLFHVTPTVHSQPEASIQVYALVDASASKRGPVRVQWFIDKGTAADFGPAMRGPWLWSVRRWGSVVLRPVDEAVGYRLQPWKGRKG